MNKETKGRKTHESKALPNFTACCPLHLLNAKSKYAF